MSRILRRHRWKNAKKIEEYIKNQLKEDEVNGQMTIFDFDPFTDSKK